MSISPATADAYTATALQIRNRYIFETLLQPEENPAQFAAWLRGRYKTLAPASRRSWQASLVHFQRDHHPDHIPGPIPPDMPNRAEIRKRHGKRTSAKKAKRIPIDIQNAIIERLERLLDREKASEYNLWALAFVQAGVAFGLRPSEWRRARFFCLEDGSMVLEVVNGKQSGERAFGPMRTLMLDEFLLDPAAIDAARWLIGRARGMTAKEFGKVIVNANRQLQRVIASCGKPCRLRNRDSITLYTARHQFAANAKRAGLSRVEIAALMGHASPETATAHYGRRQHGRDTVGVNLRHDNGSMPNNRRPGFRVPVWPHPDDVQAVQDIVDRKAQKGAPDPGMRP